MKERRLNHACSINRGTSYGSVLGDSGGTVPGTQELFTGRTLM